MANKKALKQKNIERLSFLELAHPGELTEQEQIELKKLQGLRAKHG